MQQNRAENLPKIFSGLGQITLDIFLRIRLLFHPCNIIPMFRLLYFIVKAHGYKPFYCQARLANVNGCEVRDPKFGWWCYSEYSSIRQVYPPQEQCCNVYVIKFTKPPSHRANLCVTNVGECYWNILRFLWFCLSWQSPTHNQALVTHHVTHATLIFNPLQATYSSQTPTLRKLLHNATSLHPPCYAHTEQYSRSKNVQVSEFP